LICYDKELHLKNAYFPEKKEKNLDTPSRPKISASKLRKLKKGSKNPKDTIRQASLTKEEQLRETLETNKKRKRGRPSKAEVEAKLQELKEKEEKKAPKLVEESDLKAVAGEVEDVLKQKEVIWQPQEGPQTEFLQSSEDEVLFSGARGGGKSDALIVDPLRYCDQRRFRALLLRNTMPELRELIDRAKILYPQVYPGVKWKEQEKLFVFPSGARVEFGYASNKDDIERYRGQEYTWLGIDELTKFPEEEMLDRLIGSMRSSDPNLKVFKRYTTNPFGVGKLWVRDRFVDKGPASSTIFVKPEFTDEMRDLGLKEEDLVTTRRWIDSDTKDNKILLQSNPTYLAELANLPDILKPAWLYGDWYADVGVAFNDFKRKTHVIEPFDIPHDWYRFRACDWGYSTMAVCLWFAVDYDKNVYVYRELKTTKVVAEQFARTVNDIERNEWVKYGVLDSSTWSKRGESGSSIAETMMNAGCNWYPSDRSPGSRVAGKILLHQYLQELDGHPKIRIFNNCKQLIRELSTLEVDEKNPEDVDTDMEDHAYDALRYGLTSRPQANQAFFGWQKMKQQKPIAVDPVFGY